MAAFMVIDEPQCECLDSKGGARDSANSRPSCARPGRVRDPSPHEPVSTRTLKKEKRQGRSLPLTRTNVALLAALDRLFQFGPGGEFCYFAGRNLDCGSGLRVAPVAGFSLRDGESAEADQRYPVSFL